MLVDNEQCRDNRAACGEQFCDKKERSRKLSKTVIINAALILSSVPRKILKSVAVNHSKNAGVVITVPKASEDRIDVLQPCLYRYNKTVGGDICKGF